MKCICAFFLICCSYNFPLSLYMILAACRLSIDQLNCETYRKLCNKLNDKMENKDWRTLAGKMGYSSGEVKDFERGQNAADALLQNWKMTSNEHDVPALIELLKKMERNDLVELLESHPDKSSVT